MGEISTLNGAAGKISPVFWFKKPIRFRGHACTFAGPDRKIV